MRKQLKRI